MIIMMIKNKIKVRFRLLQGRNGDRRRERTSPEKQQEN